MSLKSSLCIPPAFEFVLRACIVVGGAMGMVGCASSPLLQSSNRPTIDSPLEPQLTAVSHHQDQNRYSEFQETQIERGRPNVVIDGVGWVMGVPTKLYLWNRKADNHSISPQTEQELQEYLASRGLDDVKVRLNQYDPIGEWQRLAANKEVGAGWRYTFGGFKTLGYTLFPGRVFGGDDYNPYTNSVYVYSDVPELAMAEAARANDVTGRVHPGSYAFVQSLPIIKMHGETIATDDVLAYVKENQSLPEQQEAVQVLYPRYGLRAGQSISSVFPGAGSVAVIGGAVAGHATGKVRSTRLVHEHRQQIAQAEERQREAQEHEERTRAYMAAFEQKQRIREAENESPMFDWSTPPAQHDVPTEISRAGFVARD